MPITWIPSKHELIKEIQREVAKKEKSYFEELNYLKNRILKLEQGEKKENLLNRIERRLMRK